MPYLPHTVVWTLDALFDSDLARDRCEADLTIGTWTDVKAFVDMDTRTWKLFVNGTQYQSPDPLGFRGSKSVAGSHCP